MTITIARRKTYPVYSDRLTLRERFAELRRIYSGAAQRAEVRLTHIGFDSDPTTASGRVETFVIVREAKP